MSYTRTAADPTKYLYNGGVEQNNYTSYYETFYRQYDASIGRFGGIDVMASSFSSLTPYNYAYNDPVYWNDPLGDDASTDIGALFKDPHNDTVWERFKYGNGDSYDLALGGGHLAPESQMERDISELYHDSIREYYGFMGEGEYAAKYGGGGSRTSEYKYVWVKVKGEKHDYRSHDGKMRSFKRRTKSKWKRVLKKVRFGYRDPSVDSYANEDQDTWETTGKLFSDEGKAYRFMWDNSFDQKGNVNKEVAAFLTNEGVLVLPTRGMRRNGEYGQNGPRHSYNDFLRVTRSNRSKQLYVHWTDKNGVVRSLKINKQVHTHPNKQVISNVEVDKDLDTQAFLKIPIIIIKHNGFYNLLKQNLGRREEYFNNTKSLIK